MSRLLLVDGNSIINRAYYAVIGRTQLTAPDGTPTGAVNGFFNSVLSVSDEYKPDNICVLFDRREKTFRHLMSDEYKANRKGMPDDLAQQMPVVKEILDLMGIARTELAGYEADDLIGTLSKKGEEEGMEVFILSGDHDDFQLISGKTSVVLPQSGKGKPPRVLFDKAKFEETYGVSPDVFVYVKCLMGDSSDNIKGVEKVGEKTAFKLIAEYGNLDGVLENTDKLAPALQRNIEAARDRLDLNLRLCTIDRDAPTDMTIEKTKYEGIPDRQALYDKLDTLALRSLIKKLNLTDLTSTQTLTDDEGDDEFKNKILAHADKLFSEIKREETESIKDAVAKEIESCGRIGVEFINTDTQKKAAIVLWNEGKGFVLDAEELASVFENIKTKITGYDYKDTARILSEPLPDDIMIFDTKIAGCVLNQVEGKEDFVRLFESVTAKVCPWSQYKREAKQLSFFDTEEPDDSDEFFRNALQKTVLNIAIGLLQENKISGSDLEFLIYDVEFPLIKTLDKIERCGMHVSRQRLNDLHTEYSKKISQLESDIFRFCGREFNINSPKQLSDVLFSETGLNLPHGKKSKTGAYSTGIDELNRLKDAHPVIPLLIEYREFSKLDSTYAVGLEKTIRDDDRIHTTFTQALTNTGRLSSTEPNLQNIPVRSDEGAKIRQTFTAPEGKVLVDADYSQIELRLLAGLSGDEFMCKAFREGVDIHTMTAMRVFGVDTPEEVTHKMRSTAKTVNFSIIYGISEYGLSTDLQIGIYEAADIIKKYNKQFPGVTEYLNKLKSDGEKNGYVETMFHRRRYLNELKSQNKNVRNFGLRAAMNTPIQGTAADIIKIAMNKVQKALEDNFPEAKLVMQVHDELIVEAPEAQAEGVAKLLKEQMETAVNFNIPLIADCNIGKDWLSAK